MSLIDQKNINELVSLYKNKSFEELLNKSKSLLKDYLSGVWVTTEQYRKNKQKVLVK